MGASLRDRASRASHGAAKRLRHPAAIACAYGALAILSFGHSAAQSYRDSKAEYAECRLREKADPKHVFCFDDSGFEAGGDGLFAAILWPLYWSWELQQ